MVITLVQIEVFMLVLARVAGIFINAPVFSARTFPSTAKTALVIWIAALLCFVVPVKTLPSSPVVYMVLIFTEVMIGTLIGFVCHILFSAIQAFGDLVDLQMGTSIATAMDPTTGTVSSMVGKLCFYVGLTVFLIINGHHMLLSAINQSFRLIPAGSFINISGNMILQLVSVISSMLLIAVQLAIPALLVIFISDFSFGIVSRVAPQVNVFMLGFQVKPSLGLLILAFSMPLVVNHISIMLGQMMQEILTLLINIK